MYQRGWGEKRPGPADENPKFTNKFKAVLPMEVVMFDFYDALFLLVETKALITRALISFAVFLVVYKFLLPLMFRSRKLDTVLVMSILFLLLMLSLKVVGLSTGW